MRRATQFTAIVIGIGVLGCSGLLGTQPVDRPGFSIEMLQAAIVDDHDRGASGNVDVEWAIQFQSIAWDPIDEETSLEEHASQMLQAIRSALATDGVAVADDVEFVEGTVDGQRSLFFVVPVEGAATRTTVWQCPDAGILLTLNTSGLAVEEVHDRAVASARCKQEPLTLAPIARIWRFTGDPEQWTSERLPSGEQWNRNDGEAAIGLEVLAADSVSDDLCEVTMNIAVDSPDMNALPVGRRFESTPTGCVQHFQSRTDDGGTMFARLGLEACQGQALMASCFVFGGDVDAVCNDLVVCDETAAGTR